MSIPSSSATLARREFVTLFTGIVGGLALPGLSTSSAFSDDTGRAALDESYLEKGLTGMARSQGWFNAHLGAAVLAGYYLCRENNLSDATVAGIKKQLDALIDIHAKQFEPFPKLKADEKLIEKVPTSLQPAVDGGLRAHGHAVIYTALSVRALRDVPHMAGPQLINLLCSHNGVIAKKTPVLPKKPVDYPDSQAMVEALFDSLARFEPLLGRPSVRRPNFTHMTTHTEALMTLESLGYPELAKVGQLGQQAHIAEPVPEFDPAKHPLDEHQVTLHDVMSKEFWESEQNLRWWNKSWSVDENPNGYWVAFGHLFKVLYSYHRVVKRIQDEDKVRLCSQVLLERYVNPNVQGG
ncbi:MAG: hypothetical protein KDA88_03800 [Planctomycetaceae bacterium]|nr:hypothetical protein [Planctomycetaceae bacterium]MCB9950882.1 hypothetical protein [Planctomycetaceae bacterium]